jgi:glucose/arabinose dehydrogenase
VSHGTLQSAVTFTEPQLRTVVFGRTHPGVTTVRLEGPGRPRDVRVGPAGAFLLLYDGRVAANQVRVTPR